MELKKYLIDTFNFNTQANLKVLEKIKLMPEPSDAIRFFSHLINCQFKWMARIKKDTNLHAMDWWLPLYEVNELENKWKESSALWLRYVDLMTDDELMKEVTFVGHDGSLFAATSWDLALQLNYHSIHHRAQIQALIRQQGLTPDFIDYIGTRYRKIG
jgi:uncharacterized damage-inducible protein DinB